MFRRLGVFLCVLLLSGCAARQDAVQEAMDFRVRLLEAKACRFSAAVTADFGERVCDFSLDCVYAPQENEASLTVTAPDSIAGITATVAGGEAEVAFDGLRLELGTLPGGRAVPLQLPRILGDAWAYGYIESEAEIPGGHLVTWRAGSGDEELLVYTWFDEQRVPTEAVVYCGSVRVLGAELRGFSLSDSLSST